MLCELSNSSTHKSYFFFPEIVQIDIGSKKYKLLGFNHTKDYWNLFYIIIISILILNIFYIIIFKNIFYII